MRRSGGSYLAEDHARHVELLDEPDTGEAISQWPTVPPSFRLIAPFGPLTEAVVW
jgi:hypothetical protein